MHCHKSIICTKVQKPQTFLYLPFPSGRGTNTVERYQNALIRYGKQSLRIYWEVFRDLEIKEDFLKPYKPSEDDKLAARDDKFFVKDLLNLIDSSKKIVDDFKMLSTKMTAFVLQSITPAGEEKIKER